MKQWPDFFLIGAMKAGSTALHHCLKKHPDVFMSTPKEPGFFSRDNRFSKGPNWYRTHFKGAVASQVWGDSSTCYSRSTIYPKTAIRIHDVRPNARFIYVVRDPVVRAFSHYKHRMDEAVIAGNPILSYKQFLNDDKEVLMTGRYYFQIKPYYDLFGAENIHVCSFDDLVSNTQVVLNKVWNFLNVNPDFSNVAELPNKNESGSSLIYFHTNNTIKNIRNSSLLKPFIDVMPNFLKEVGVSVIRSNLMKSQSIRKVINKEHEFLSKPDNEDLKYLSKYYRNDLTDFHALTGVDVSHWQSFRNNGSS